MKLELDITVKFTDEQLKAITDAISSGLMKKAVKIYGTDQS